DVADVEAAVQRGHRPVCDIGEQRQMPALGVKVQDVELVHSLADLAQHVKVRGNVPREAVIEPDCLAAAGNEPGVAPAVSAREQGNLVSAPDEFVGKMGNNALGTAVEARRYAFVEGG